MLGGWLHEHTRFVAGKLMRTERRRQLRERQAAEMNAIEDHSESNLAQVAPVLDEAIGQLDAEDRTAILLRFFERKDFRSVGEALGSSEDAARKRVDRALEKLHVLLKHRGATLSAAALGTALATEAVTAAPAGLAATISSAAATATTFTRTVTATKAIAMTTLQKALVTATVTVLAGAGIYEVRQTAQLRKQVQTLQQQHTPLAERVQQLALERDEATNKLRAVLEEGKQWRHDAAELPKLRARLTRVSQELAELKTEGGKVSDEPLESVADSWAKRAVSLKRWFQENPDKSIPELQLLKEADWLFIASRNLVVATNDLQRRDYNSFAMIASDLRQTAKRRFAVVLAHALSNYIEANAGALPGDLTQLTSFFGSQSDDNSTFTPPVSSILQRYQLLHTGQISNVPQEEAIVVERSPADEQVDTLLKVQAGSFSFQSVGIIDMMAGEPISWRPADVERIKPFLK